MLLGNDLAKNKVVAEPIVTHNPDVVLDSSDDTDLYPSCVVTRAMAKETQSDDSLETESKDIPINLSDTFFGNTDKINQENIAKKSQSIPLPDVDHHFIGRKQLVEEQKKDPEVLRLRLRAQPSEEADKVSECYYLNGDVLMRKWRPPDAKPDEEWQVQVVYELGIKQYKSSVYHPESQGVLERFHQTLKNMIRTFCMQYERDWDDGIHFLLFAARESVQESLGFSPFELKIRRKEYMNISRIQNFEHCYEKFAYRPVMFLRFIKTTSLPKVQDTPHFTPHSMLSMTQEIDVEDLIKLLCVIKFTNRGKLQINQLLLTLKSSAECQKSFEVKGVDSFNHISCMTPDRVWVSDFNKIILTDKATGNKIHVVKDPLHSFSGSHTVNSTQELIYINKKHKIIKLSKDRKTTNTFIKKPKSLWEPSCLYSSPSSGDLLVGMHRHDTNTGTGIVIRYDNTGNYIQTIPHINIPQKLYGLPMFITENNNGDVVVSDVCMHAVVVTSSEGNHRFSYTGTSTSRSDYCTSKIWWPKGSGLSPRGICTDALSHILVCDIYSDTVQMLSQDGQFLKYLAKDSHAFLPSSLSYDVQSHCLFVGHQPWQTKISLYRHINRVQLAPMT
uniref:Uncharacterized protein LOC111117149 n=1 Tax=Crassostrea virginica TaxID=6565 RepID=A0A8B8C870_CRAVI|nr:uncharacterized protein LOC111117149 [Crassostrea virginica]